MKNPVVTLKIQGQADVKIELYPDIAPNTVANFVDLVQKGFYDGLIFHRVIKGFMIQGGCPKKNGTGGPGYGIKGEFTRNGFNNTLAHTEGVISMARAQPMDSAGSQFFIMHKHSPHLDGLYAGFGKVIEGMDVIDAIANLNTNHQDKPLEDVVIETMTLECNDYVPVEPQTVS